MSVRHEGAKRTMVNSLVMGVRGKGLTRRTNTASSCRPHQGMADKRINARNNRGFTLLLLALSRGRVDFARILLERSRSD